MKLKTEMLDFHGRMLPRTAVASAPHFALEHDAAAAHAMMQALDEWGEKPRNVDYVCVRWVRLRADELMRQWGFNDE